MGRPIAGLLSGREDLHCRRGKWIASILLMMKMKEEDADSHAEDTGWTGTHLIFLMSTLLRSFRPLGN